MAHGAGDAGEHWHAGIRFCRWRACAMGVRLSVRELRQNASKYLEEVAAGKSIEITDRDRPVARLVPFTADPWRDLVSAGDAVLNLGGLAFLFEAAAEL